MKSTFSKSFLLSGIFFCTILSVFSAQEEKREEQWKCYPVYSSLPDKKGIQCSGGMYCYIAEENSKEISERFMIIGEKINEQRKDNTKVIYSTENWWRGCFLYIKKSKIIVLAEQSDNANCAIKVFSCKNNNWKQTSNVDAFELVENGEKWPEDKHWKGYVSNISYNEVKDVVVVNMETSQGNYVVTGKIRKNIPGYDVVVFEK